PRAGTLGNGVRPALRDAFDRAYTGRQALSRAFSYAPASRSQAGPAGVGCADGGVEVAGAFEAMA
ncbi:hypothetical protein ACFV17_41445, partial [Streptomyces sp. NPDC059656]